MKNDTIEKTVKNNYDFVDNKAKTYCQASNKRVQKRSRKYYIFQKMKKL